MNRRLQEVPGRLSAWLPALLCSLLLLPEGPGQTFLLHYGEGEAESQSSAVHSPHCLSISVSQTCWEDLKDT